MKVYLAAQYPRRDELREVARELGKRGVDVTSRWLQEKLPLNIQLNGVSESDLLSFAKIDIEDIRQADTLVLFSEDPLVGLPRGTHHAEFGFALGLGKHLIVVGGYENVFHYLPQVVHYATVQDFLDAEGIQNAAVAD